MLYFCCDERRRAAVRNHPTINGIDFLEVLDDPLDNDADRQRTLLVHFLKSVAPGAIKVENVHIEGGERIRNIAVTSVVNGPASSPPQGTDVLIVEVARHGDFSIYTLRLVAVDDDDDPPEGFDPILSAVDFSFKVNCPTDFDCNPQRLCPTEPGKNPEINYLVKDYASFRQLMLDRMSLLMPDWRERRAADLGIVLVEMLAYVGDYLSYQQDAVATESYLNTARRRASVRRHARLVDYPMHDGRNARAWLHVEVTDAGDGLVLSRGKDRTTTKLLTGVGALEGVSVLAQDSNQFEKALSERPQIFELLHEITLFKAHNKIRFYTWGARECCLPKGALKAVLYDDLSNSLKPGDVLVLVENRGPQTGKREDADQSHRHAVRLTSVRAGDDPLGGQFKSPPDNAATPITEIEWSTEDALPFPLCVSTTVANDFFDDGALALGNIMLVDHGFTTTDEPENLSADLEFVDTSLDPAVVPGPLTALTRITPSSTSRCEAATKIAIAPRYRPRLKFFPLTQVSPYDPANPPKSATATREILLDDSKTLPLAAITLKDPSSPQAIWKPLRDLLGSDSADEDFVVEVETDGTAYLRFGDGTTGRRPPEGVKFLATYRIGNGTAGNVGADSIRHLVTSDAAFLDPTAPAIASVSNPLPAIGGVDPETIEHVRQNAPSAFRRQERAITPADYEALTIRRDVVQRCGLDVQRSSAMLRWTGSWYTMFLTADRLGGRVVDEDFENDLRGCLERYRMAGQDLEIDEPSHVSLEIEMKICIKSGYFFEDVQEALLKVFSNRTQADGSRGVFHPDNFTFGQPVLLSRIIATAQAVTGVASAEVTKFQRQGTNSTVALESGGLVMGRREIARLDNDRNFPERGVFTLKRA